MDALLRFFISITIPVFCLVLWRACFCCREEIGANSENQPRRRRQQQNDIELGLPQITTTRLPQTLTIESPQHAVSCMQQAIIIVKIEVVTYDHEKMQNGAAGPSPCSTTCTICLDDFKDGDNCAVMKPCQHMYHEQCIETWLKLNQNCPYCRGSPPMERLQILLVSDQSSSYNSSIHI